MRHPRITTDPAKILDVFQPGLIRGAARLPFDPEKRYFYVEHPTEGWRVYLRACCFVHEFGKPFDASRFLVVKRREASANGKEWEPPKGQMEGKDGLRDPSKSVRTLLRENLRREVSEEAAVDSLRSLEYTEKVIQSVEDDYPPKTFFQYHIFRAFASPKQIEEAFDHFQWLREHPKAFARMKRDVREKDAVGWYDAKRTKMMGKWSPTLVAVYLARD